MKRNKVLIIAEAGVNHNGSIEIAKKMIDEAMEAGADIIKFQTFHADQLTARNMKKAAYQEAATDRGENQYEMLKRLELDEHDHRELIDHCTARGVRFLSSPFDMESIEMLGALGQSIWKIPSGEITNVPYLRKIGMRDEEIILSTGMANLGEVEAALGVLESAGTDRSKISVLHCTTEYPAPYSEVNLNAMRTLKQAFGVKVGYSDHTEGIEISIAAVALGATIIEKHFTLDRNMIGPDHKASIDPTTLRELVKSIRNIEAALGDGIKRPSISESMNKPIARKVIVASRRISAGEVLDQDNMTIKRAEFGEDPTLWDRLVGRKSTRDYLPDEGIWL